jgi:hypothetical protein
VERELGGRVVGIRRMTGGIVAAVHRLTVEHVPSGRRELVVLRQYERHGGADLSPADPGRWPGQMADMAARIHEAAITTPAPDQQYDGDWRLAVPADASRPGLWRTLDRPAGHRRRAPPAEPGRAVQRGPGRAVPAAYEARAGRRVDPWWDLCALASYNDSWPQFIPVQGRPHPGRRGRDDRPSRGPPPVHAPAHLTPGRIRCPNLLTTDGAAATGSVVD